MGAVAALVVGLTIAGSSSAHADASGVVAAEGLMLIVGASGVDNKITITRSGDLFRIVDTGGDGIVRAHQGCQRLPNEGVTVCQAAGITQINVVLHGGDDTLTANVATSVLADGGGGNDVLSGGSSSGPMQLIGSVGNDVLIGGVTDDTVDGGAGDDALGGGPGTDTVTGGAGNDTLDGGAGTDTLSGGAGRDAVHGGPGTDRVTYQGTQESVTLLLDNLANDGVLNEGDNVFDTVENAIGGAGPDFLIGSAAPNAFRGGGGDDVLLGRGGDDVMLGDAGDDFLNGDAGNDLLDGNAGVDTLFGSDGNDTLGAKDGTQDKTVDGGAGTDSCTVDPVDPRASCETVL